jgi:hypothetical protein
MLAGFGGFIALLYSLVNHILVDIMMTMTGVFVGYAILIMLISAILIFATLKENTSLLKAWLIIVTAAAATSLILDIVLKLGRVGIALVPLDVLLQIYCLLVVNSYRVEILTKNGDPSITGAGKEQPANNEFENKVYTKNENKETSQ